MLEEALTVDKYKAGKMTNEDHLVLGKYEKEIEAIMQRLEPFTTCKMVSL